MLILKNSSKNDGIVTDIIIIILLACFNLGLLPGVTGRKMNL